MIESFVDGPLKLELVDDPSAVSVIFTGRSVAREPALFVLPILTRALDLGQRTSRRIVFDFRSLEYLNSSSITPLIRTLEQVKKGTAQLTVFYKTELKWQALAFSALHLFGTSDGRVRIQGN